MNFSQKYDSFLKGMSFSPIMSEGFYSTLSKMCQSYVHKKMYLLSHTCNLLEKYHSKIIINEGKLLFDENYLKKY